VWSRVISIPNEALQRRRNPEWVSKTDIMRFRRCPYAFWLLDTGQVKQEATLTDVSRAAIERGVAFEAKVLEKVPELPEPLTIEQITAGKSQVLGIDMLSNPDLQIFGVPDGVDPAKGAAVPIEIKSRGRPFQSDAIELAFYWLLLEPWRKRKSAAPHGKLLLEHQGRLKERLLDLEPEHFAEVRRLIEGVRAARRDGVRPLLCECDVCRERPELPEQACLLVIHGISTVRANALAQLGVTSFATLACADAGEVNRRFEQPRPGLANIRRWKAHAEAMTTGTVVRVGSDTFTYPSRFIVLDLEWDPYAEVWLFGLLIVTDGKEELIQFWADRKEQRRRAIRNIERILCEHPLHPVMTWNGTIADLPRLNDAARSIGNEMLKPLLLSRHFDVYRFVDQNLRFPSSKLGLKEVGQHFKVGRKSKVAGGMEALALYYQYRSCDGPKKREQIRDRLLKYNADDLTSLAKVMKHLVKLNPV
jgi:predicted RecB family nuclease